MAIPGTLSIGLIREDNPLKAYFCFKPILRCDDGLFHPCDETQDYPDNGALRIVPDKNESGHFKARMRRIGLMAVADLRSHPAPNDKIRLNKNYHGEENEQNRCILYSDVIDAPPEGFIYTVLDMTVDEAENACLNAPLPTPLALLRSEGTLFERTFACERDEADPDVYRLACTQRTAPTESIAVFEGVALGDQVACIAVDMAMCPKESPQKTKPAVEPDRSDEPAAQPEKGAPEAEDKPWLLRKGAQAAANERRTGLNPRKGPSLKEIVDEKWQQSRIEQLGLTAQDLTTDAPVHSPAEAAVEAMKAAWELPDQREALVSAFADLEGAQTALELRRRIVRQSEIEAQLTELEAQRLEMLDEMQKLREGGQTLRETLKKEIRKDEAEAFADLTRRTDEAREKHDRAQQELTRIRKASDAAQDALNALADGRFEARLNAFAIDSRAAELLRHPGRTTPVAPQIVGEDRDAEQMIQSLRAAFAEAGMTIAHTDAVNLLICAAQSRLTILSGAPGSGKTATALLLARALGLEKDRLIDASRATLREDAASLKAGAVPGLLLLDDENLEGSHVDAVRACQGERGAMSLLMTVQDRGCPLPDWLVGRAFFIRLSEDATAPWQPRAAATPRTLPPVSLSAFREAFGPRGGALPQAMMRRMEHFRSDLALCGLCVSRAALEASWNYCSAAVALMRLEPSAVLDLALSQRVLPSLIAPAGEGVREALLSMMADLPRCHAMLKGAYRLLYGADGAH